MTFDLDISLPDYTKEAYQGEYHEDYQVGYPKEDTRRSSPRKGMVMPVEGRTPVLVYLENFFMLITSFVCCSLN